MMPTLSPPASQPRWSASTRWRIRGALLAGLAMLGSAGLAHADALVVNAQGVDLKPGSAVKETQALAVPAGGSVQVILQSGATLTLQGPYSGSIAEYGRSRGVSTGLESSPTRGVGATRGGTR